MHGDWWRIIFCKNYRKKDKAQKLKRKKNIRRKNGILSSFLWLYIFFRFFCCKDERTREKNSIVWYVKYACSSFFDAHSYIQITPILFLFFSILIFSFDIVHLIFWFVYLFRLLYARETESTLKFKISLHLSIYLILMTQTNLKTCLASGIFKILISFSLHFLYFIA